MYVSTAGEVQGVPNKTAGEVQGVHLYPLLI
jgi:hypothetical protein